MSGKHDRWMKDMDAYMRGEWKPVLEEGCTCSSCETVGCSLCSRVGCVMHFREDTKYPAGNRHPTIHEDPI